MGHVFEMPNAGEAGKAGALESCPFCGSNDILIIEKIDYWVLCNNCNASTETSSSKESAIKKWNRRIKAMEKLVWEQFACRTCSEIK